MADEEPGDVAAIRAFVNTVDVEDGTDVLTTPAAFAEWLAGRGVRADVSAADLHAARRVRGTLRHLMGDPEESADPAAIADVPLQLTLAGSEPVVSGAAAGVPGYLGDVLAAVSRTVAQGTWVRLKVCANDTCRWAFYDRSKNRAGRWCTMAVCGNRTKTRAYRERHR